MTKNGCFRGPVFMFHYELSRDVIEYRFLYDCSYGRVNKQCKLCHYMWTPWRNGSASDSRSEGCVFKSRRGQWVLMISMQNHWLRRRNIMWYERDNRHTNKHSLIMILVFTKQPAVLVLFVIHNQLGYYFRSEIFHHKSSSPQWGSNSRPLVYKTSALATELWRQICFRRLTCTL